MALPASGPLALYVDIRAEELSKEPNLSVADLGLREVSLSAGFTQPDHMSEFHGYSSVMPITFTANPVELGKNDVSINIRQNANTFNNGNGTISSRGFYFGTSTNRASNTKYQVDTSNSLGQFDRNFTSLSGGTTYRMWAYVENEVGESYSGMTSITTLAAVSLNVTSNVGTQFYIDGYTSSAVHNWSWGDLRGQHQYQHPYYGMVTTGNRGYSASLVASHGWLNWYFQAAITRAKNSNTRQEFQNGAYIAISGELYVASSETNGSWYSRTSGFNDNSNKTFSINTYTPWGGPFTGTVSGSSGDDRSSNTYNSHWSYAPTNGNPKIESYTYFTRVGGAYAT